MSHKTITLSEDAYNVLNTLRKGKESFTDVILRDFTESKSRDLLNYVKTMEIDRETLILASDVEEIYKNREKVKFKERDF
ncbi:MAG: antitoxin VapB family protein [Halobacteriota archaeon]